MKQRIIVFGGSGFVGQALCQEALKQDFTVISISKHGKPQADALWMTDHRISWITMDIFKDDSWKKYLDSKTVCVNLIGILFENKKKGLTYEKMIIRSNHLIATEAEKKEAPYIFLSAKGGPTGYVSAKQAAEKELLSKKMKAIIIRSGLIVSKKHPLRYLQGMAIKLGNKLPVIDTEAAKVYPTELDHLVHQILNDARQPRAKIIEDIR